MVAKHVARQSIQVERQLRGGAFMKYTGRVTIRWTREELNKSKLNIETRHQAKATVNMSRLRMYIYGARASNPRQDSTSSAYSIHYIHTRN